MIDIELQRARSAMAESVTLPIAMWLEALDELEALRQTRLVQQAEQEPDDLDWITPEAVFEAKLKLHGIPNPPVQQVDLTVSELDAIIDKHYDDEMDLKAMILDGIAAYKEKNR